MRKVVLSPMSFSPLQEPVTLVAVPYFCWFGAQPVAPDVNRKYTPLRLNIAGASRELPAHRFWTWDWIAV